MKSEKELKVGYRSPLNELDTEEQTYGCRANNPDICGFSYLDGVCAFVREDGICKHPTNSWRKQYAKLKKE